MRRVLDAIDRGFAPVWAGGWDATRVLFALSQLWAHALRWGRIDDAYASADMVFTTGPWRLADYVIFTPATATGLWFAGLAGLLALVWGGRAAKPGLAVYVVTAWALLAEEALSVRAHDRLALWMAIGFLFAPIGERGLADKARSPFARWWLLVVFCAIYGSTGVCKLFHEPAWLDGTALQYHLVHRYFAARPISLWVSAHWPLTLVAGWWTLAFEVAFPVLVWFRRTNPLVLALAAAFHVGVLVLMDVGPFSLVSMAAYPVLLHPDVARGLHQRWVREAGA